MKKFNLTSERKQELIDIYKSLPTERTKAVDFDSSKVAEDYDDIVLAPGQDKDYKISYWDKDNKETYICLGAMNEMDAEDRFNGMFPGNIFISAKEIQI